MKHFFAKAVVLFALCVFCFLLFMKNVVPLGGSLMTRALDRMRLPPYEISINSVRPAPADATAGYRVDQTSRTLYVVSGQDVKVISDPNAAFKWEVVWILETPRPGGESGLLELKYDLPKSGEEPQVNPPSVSAPMEVRQAAQLK